MKAFRFIDVQHKCSLPRLRQVPGVTLSVVRWRCGQCKGRWRGEVGTASATWKQVGKASRSWRRKQSARLVGRDAA